MKKLILITVLLTSNFLVVAQLKIGTEAKKVKYSLEEYVDRFYNTGAQSTSGKTIKLNSLWDNGKIVEIEFIVQNGFMEKLDHRANYRERYIMKNGVLDEIRTEYYDVSINELKGACKKWYEGYFIKSDKKGDYYLENELENYNYIFLGDNGLATHLVKRLVDGGFSKEFILNIKIKNEKLIKEKEEAEIEKKEKQRLEEEAKEKAKYPKYGRKIATNQIYFIRIKGNGKRMFIRGDINSSADENSKHYRGELKKIYNELDYINEDKFELRTYPEEYDMLIEMLAGITKKGEYLLQVNNTSQEIEEWNKPKYLFIEKRIAVNEFYFEDFYLYVGKLLNEKKEGHKK